MIVYDNGKTTAEVVGNNLIIDARESKCPYYQSEVMAAYRKCLNPAFEEIHVWTTERSVASHSFQGALEHRAGLKVCGKNFSFTNQSKDVKISYNEPAVLKLKPIIEYDDGLITVRKLYDVLFFDLRGLTSSHEKLEFTNAYLNLSHIDHREIQVWMSNTEVAQDVLKQCSEMENVFEVLDTNIDPSALKQETEAPLQTPLTLTLKKAEVKTELNSQSTIAA